MKKIKNLISQKTRPKEGKMAKVNFNRFRMTMLLLMLSVVSMIASGCRKPTRTEKMWLKGMEMYGFDYETAKKFLKDKEVIKLMIYFDNKFENVDEKGATWLSSKYFEMEKEGPGKIDGDGTVFNPTLSANVDEVQWDKDSANIARFNYIVRPTRTPVEDPCDPIRAQYKIMWDDFVLDRDSCFTYFLPQCMAIDGYEDLWNLFTSTDSLLRPQKVLDKIGNNINNLPVSEQVPIKGAARTGTRGHGKEEIVTKFYNTNIHCLR